MKPPVDLHIHSTYSDGTCTIEEIVSMAITRGMRWMALSDHDTTDGLVPIAKLLNSTVNTQHTVHFIPAIEMSSGANGLTHILGYGVKPSSQPLEAELTLLRRKRIERTRKTMDVLKRLTGTSLSEEFLENADALDHTIGRVHVARQMISNQLVKTVEEAFYKYLGVGKPAFVPLEHISSEDAITTLRKSQIVPVMAHPMRSGLKGERLEQFIMELKDKGLMGLEVFHPSARQSDVKRLYSIARKLDLLVTGGSDFHGDRSMRTKIGEYPLGWQTWQEDIDTLQAAINDASAW